MKKTKIVIAGGGFAGLYAAKYLDFTFDELCTLSLNGFESSFLPWEQRMQMLAQVSMDLEVMSGEEE